MVLVLICADWSDTCGSWLVINSVVQCGSCMHICLFKIVCFLLAWFIFALLIVLLFRFAVLEFVGFRLGVGIWFW